MSDALHHPTPHVRQQCKALHAAKAHLARASASLSPNSVSDQWRSQCFASKSTNSGYTTRTWQGPRRPTLQDEVTSAPNSIQAAVAPNAVLWLVLQQQGSRALDSAAHEPRSEQVRQSLPIYWGVSPDIQTLSCPTLPMDSVLCTHVQRLLLSLPGGSMQGIGHLPYMCSECRHSSTA